ncbi:hypothetical protein [Oceanidesulfovibrio marinus]|uniref:Uncharacterized protein n=1 Tax=Oceanidesulfovibrio marinus TaxID=370038 RepID=A0A6P1ZFL7_9BACT|nr:hypothetical protein [Oceanidesulfovibrio marinus]TVM31200.1 hypothetical protein DQK91_19000 [Oceanidesulfovibrio marinus]
MQHHSLVDNPFSSLPTRHTVQSDVKTSLELNRVNRRLLLGLTLVWVTIDSVQCGDMSSENAAAAEIAVGQMEQSRRRCWRHLCPSAKPGSYGEGVEIDLGGAKAQRRYDRMIAGVANVLETHMEDESDPRLFMNCVLTFLERIRDTVPAALAERRRDWDALVERYAALYVCFDPDMESSDMDAGEALGQALLEVLG